MEERSKQTVFMTEEEKAEFEAFQQAKARKAAEEKAKADREMYRQMVDEEIENSIPVLLGISEEIKESKQKVLDNFKAILAMKSDLFKTKMRNDQRSHTFTNSAGDKRITLGVYVTDGYRDTVEDGIAIVKEYIASLANDEKTQALVNMVFRLLSRDAKGTLKASRIVQLRKVADELGTNLPVLSMAWILQHPEISCVIAGASKPSQLENNMKAAGFVIPADAMAEIDKITGFHRFERHVG